jgi:hypothetical protein
VATQGRGEATYRKLLTEGKAQGWTVREVARRSGIPYWTLVGWSRRLAREREREQPSVLPVTVVASEPLAREVDGECAVLHLRSGHRLVLPPRLTVADLARLVRAVESSGC